MNRHIYLFLRLSIAALTLCQPGSGVSAPTNVERTFFVISDIHLDNKTTHEMEFTPSSRAGVNDLDAKTYHKMLVAANDALAYGTLKRPEFILVLGDVVGHTRTDNQYAWNNIKLGFSELIDNFPGTPLMFTFGNNDSLDIDYGAFQLSNEQGKMRSPIDALFEAGYGVGGFISTGTRCNVALERLPCIIEQDARAGYYSAYVAPKLRLVSLNSVMFSNYHSSNDPNESDNQLAWLERQLAAAKAQNESVLLTMHIPPGFNVHDNAAFWKNMEYEVFLGKVKRYRNIIMGILAAHTHKDELKIVQDEDDTQLPSVFLNPALSTSHGNSPAMRSYTFRLNGKQWELTNYTTFRFTKAPLGTVSLVPEYTYRDAYCKPNETTLMACLSHVTPDGITKYFTVGNPEFTDSLHYPKQIFIKRKGTANVKPNLFRLKSLSYQFYQKFTRLFS